MTFKTTGHIFVTMGRIGHCRQHILAAGTEVLYQKGYNGTGVKEITTAAGVPKGSFYNHFESKEAFVIEALEAVAAQHEEHSRAVLMGSDLSPKQRILNFFDGIHQDYKSEEFNGGCIIGNLCLEMADENEGIRATVDKLFNKQVSLIADCLRAAQDCGELCCEHCNCAELAEFIHCAWEGAVMRMKASRNCQPFTIFRNQLEQFFV
ncbi:TetR/AcrR family transcriptional regulator [Pleionea sp. CnH1-48]|uniref:TetR/AcrR family transcriptional regulator n=1 Tax=Pleionea sp. CnH1-48 TaxID=2954494 RepID=UPI002096E154|nr:TetR/AcrR family transcriptional regulator [Pleionea sp. CnH1-48]MCO7225331.1 TetR/AcrR family transcriptional regulator [Pleionea sp. CnH1-48]